MRPVKTSAQIHVAWKPIHQHRYSLDQRHGNNNRQGQWGTEGTCILNRGNGNQVCVVRQDSPGLVIMNPVQWHLEGRWRRPPELVNGMGSSTEGIRDSRQCILFQYPYYSPPGFTKHNFYRIYIFPSIISPKIIAPEFDPENIAIFSLYFKQLT